LANKQDQRNAINKEANLKDKLKIEELRRKHKIVNEEKETINIKIAFFRLGVLHRNTKRK
jgi:hypothetical protein